LLCYGKTYCRNNYSFQMLHKLDSRIYGSAYQTMMQKDVTVNWIFC
jgi:hypothetical protein